MRSRTRVLLSLLVASLPVGAGAQRVVSPTFHKALPDAVGVALPVVQQAGRMSCGQRAVLAAVTGAVAGAAAGWLMGSIVSLGGDSAESASVRRRTVVLFALAGAAGTLLLVTRTPPCVGAAMGGA